MNQLLLKIFLWLAFASSPARAEPTLRIIKTIPGTTPGNGQSSLLVSENHPTVIIGTDWGGQIRAVDLRAGKTIWSTPFNVPTATGGITSSPDGRFIILGGDKRITLANRIAMHYYLTGEKVRNFEIPESLGNMEFFSFAFSDDQQLLASSGTTPDLEPNNGTTLINKDNLPSPIAIHRVETGKFIKALSPGIRNVYGIGMSSDKKFVYAMGTDEFGFWNLDTAKRIKTIKLADIYGPEYAVCNQFESCGPDHARFVSHAIAPNLQFAAITSGKDVIIINLESQKIYHKFTLPDDLWVRKLSISETMESLFILGTPKYRSASKTSLFEWDIVDKTMVRRIDGEELPGSYGIRPFDPGATIAFINDHTQMVTLDHGEFHVPMRVPVSVWAWD